MAMNSVQTNIGAMVALQSLNRTNEEMATTQKRISTGFRVSDAKDDGAAFAVAQRVRGDIAGLGAANEQLGSTKGLLETTMGALNETSKNLTKIRETLTKLLRHAERVGPRHLLQGFREPRQPDEPRLG